MLVRLTKNEAPHKTPLSCGFHPTPQKGEKKKKKKKKKKGAFGSPAFFSRARSSRCPSAQREGLRRRDGEAQLLRQVLLVLAGDPWESP